MHTQKIQILDQPNLTPEQAILIAKEGLWLYQGQKVNPKYDLAAEKLQDGTVVLSTASYIQHLKQIVRAGFNCFDVIPTIQNYA